MEQAILPRTDLRVSRLCLGGNRFGGELDRDASYAVLDTFVEAGGTFIDTAHVYSDWLAHVEPSCSEKMLGRWRAARRPGPEIVIATKGGHHALDAPERKRLDRASLRQDALEARDNLGLESVDLFYLHRDDPARPIEDILGVLEELRSERVIRWYGASNLALARLEEAGRVAAERGWTGFVINQVEWSLARRNPASAAPDLVTMDEPMRAWHRRTGLPAACYSSQARGYFDKVAADRLDAPTAMAYDSDRNQAIAREVAEKAAQVKATPTQFALRALIAERFPVFPVVGCRTPRQVASSVAALGIDLG